ncbi:MAG: toprim domain-containing protein [Oscillospiraceae bacterium]|nr:toprim domain-containing protein [Oscillospiraceae bacterium]
MQQTVRKKLKSYKGVSQGTTDSYFQYDRGIPDKAYVFESSIDLMSFMQLYPKENNCKFVAMAGLKPTVVEDLLNKNLNVILCVDNDCAVSKFRKSFVYRCLVVTDCIKNGVNDFNELLQMRFPKRDFYRAVGDMVQWSRQVISKEREKEVRNGTHRNKSI